MIRKRTHFLTPEANTDHVTWKIWKFANDLGLLAEMLSVKDDRDQCVLFAHEILSKHFKSGSGHELVDGEFTDFSLACSQARRTETKIIGSSKHATAESASEFECSGHALFFKLFNKNAREPFFVFHGRFTRNGDLKVFTLEKIQAK